MRIVPILTLIPLLAGLSACVTAEDIDRGTATLEGRPYQYAFDRLGYPDDQREIAGKTVYTWFDRETGSYEVPTSETATTYVDGQPVYTTISGSRTEVYDNHCRLQVVVDDAGIIEQAQAKGNLAGCERYAALAPRR